MSGNSNIDPNSAPIAGAQLPPAGWYPDPHDSAAKRYWDGAQWTAHRPVAQPNAAPAAFTPSSEAAASTAVLTPATAGVAGSAVAARTGRGLPRLKWWQWALIAGGALVFVSIIVNGVNGERAPSRPRTSRRPPPNRWTTAKRSPRWSASPWARLVRRWRLSGS